MEESLNSLTILYTENLRGDLGVLPRLHNFLRRLRTEFDAEKTLLLDLGGACVSEMWHCAVTGGRSMLVALDGMGYDAANVSVYLTPESRKKLLEMDDSFRLALHEADQPYRFDGLTIDLWAASASDLHEQRLSLAQVNVGEVGVAHLSRDGGEWLLESFGVYVLTPDTLPDPTIAGLIDFIIAEARYAQKRSAG